MKCTYDPATRGGNAPDGRKVKATLHWVAAETALRAEVRLYEPLFQDVEPPSGADFIDGINPNSRETLADCRLEPSLAGVPAGTPVQFERVGYFTPDAGAGAGNALFHRIVGLRDAWARIKARGA